MHAGMHYVLLSLAVHIYLGGPVVDEAIHSQNCQCMMSTCTAVRSIQYWWVPRPAEPAAAAGCSSPGAGWSSAPATGSHAQPAETLLLSSAAKGEQDRSQQSSRH